MSAINKGRTEFVGFYVTPLEKSKIQLAADARSRNVSDYMRLSVFDLIKNQKRKKDEDADEEYAALVLEGEEEMEGEVVDERNSIGD